MPIPEWTLADEAVSLERRLPNDFDVARLATKRLLQSRRGRAQVYVSPKVDCRRQHLHPENVEVVLCAKLSDEGCELAQAHESDLIGKLQNGAKRLLAG